jgi:protein-tyrosine phosphatase
MILDKILPELFVGSCPKDVEDIDSLKKKVGITAVLNLQTDEDFANWKIDWQEMEAAYHRRGIALRRVPVQDFDPENLRRKLPACVRALDKLLRAGYKVYLHCSGGLNRSPTVVIAYLHWLGGMGLDQAADYVTERHFCEPYVEPIRMATVDWARG